MVENRMRRLVIALILVMAPAVLAAQDAAISFGADESSKDEPIEITAEQLEIDDASGVAIFTGDVRVKQGTMRMNAPRVRVEYDNTGANPNNDILRVYANGGRVLMFDGDEAAEGDDADYDVPSDVVVMTGDVVVTQKRNVLFGTKLTVTLGTGEGLMEGPVRSIIQPRNSDDAGAGNDEG